MIYILTNIMTKIGGKMKVKNKKTKVAKKVEKTLQNEITSSDTVKKELLMPLNKWKKKM